tara:strand:- start:540 stop:692 length:153 start_codon:yes stop_codon:yes gene_type:complete
LFSQAKYYFKNTLLIILDVEDLPSLEWSIKEEAYNWVCKILIIYENLDEI